MDKSSVGIRVLAIDISASPGFAVLLFKEGKPKLLHKDSIKTTNKMTDGERYGYIEAATIKIVVEHGPFDVVVREKYVGNSRSKRAKQLVYGAWAAVDMALGKYGYVIDEKEHEIVASQIKSAVAGKGGASKDEVADGVRRILGTDVVFKSDDESDAVAVGLTWAIREGLIE